MLREGYSVSDLVIMGFNGKSLSSDTTRNISKEKISQFILFTDANFESKKQLVALTDELQASVLKHHPSSLPALISADQEGGRVQRFRKDFTLLPAAIRVGTLGSTEIAYELSRIQARELFAAGVNLNFAPDCDINTNPENPVIGDRAYGSTVSQVNQMVSSVVQGHLIENVEACIKHFPGHGDTHLDSHEALPSVTTDLKTLREREWIPFKTALHSGCNFVMSAHLMLPHLDPKMPATLSTTFLNTYLREELGFAGVIISDDMQMGAIAKNYGKEEAPILALLAGCDLLCYRNEEETLIAIEAIKKSLQDKSLNARLLEVSIERVRRTKKRLKFSSSMTNELRLNLIGNPAHQEFVKHHFG